jgi:predicted nucleic acid-binding protein
MCRCTPSLSRSPGSLGRIEGEQAAQGVTIAFEDLLIASTALQLAFGVVAGNVS